MKKTVLFISALLFSIMAQAAVGSDNLQAGDKVLGLKNISGSLYGEPGKVIALKDDKAVVRWNSSLVNDVVLRKELFRSEGTVAGFKIGTHVQTFEDGYGVVEAFSHDGQVVIRYAGTYVYGIFKPKDLIAL